MGQMRVNEIKGMNRFIEMNMIIDRGGMKRYFRRNDIERKLYL